MVIWLKRSIEDFPSWKFIQFFEYNSKKNFGRLQFKNGLKHLKAEGIFYEIGWLSDWKNRFLQRLGINTSIKRFFGHENSLNFLKIIRKKIPVHSKWRTGNSIWKLREISTKWVGYMTEKLVIFRALTTTKQNSVFSPLKHK